MLDSKSNYEPVRKILLIEDDYSYARLVEILLGESDLLNCVVVNCASLAEGMQALQEQHDFSAVLLDLSLPDSFGFDTLERLLAQHPNNNIVVLTGQADKNLGVKAIRAGAQDFLVKGDFDADELAKSLRFAIERGSILSRLEDTQRIAHIGNWECQSKVYFHASDEVYRIFGLTPQKDALVCTEIMESNHPFTLLIRVQQKVKAGEATTEDLWLEQPDGTKRYVSVLCKAENNIQEGLEAVPTYSGIIQDITERKQTEELRREKDLAEKAAKIREQVIASVSHEMRTPMNVILGMSNLLLQTTPDQEQTQYIQSIKRSSEFLLQIINDILQMSAIQNGNINFVKGPFHLRELLHNLMEIMQYRQKEKDLELQLAIEEGIPDKLVGDKLRLNQILFNLLGNAIKFTEEGSVKLQVKAQLQASDYVRLRFKVTDTGIGIPETQKRQIFNAFSRVQHQDKVYEGTGLGLSITKQLVEQQGGKIDVKSTEGQGSTFYFDLTFPFVQQTTTTNQTSSPNPQIKKDNKRTFRILVVEDHKMNQIVVQKTLEKKWKNIQIFMADNGQDAICFLEKNSVDLILMDILMPVRDGFSTAAHIRKNMPPPVSQTPILAMTAHAHITQDEKFRQYGLDDFVLKPFDPEQLFSKIEHFLL